MLSQNLNDIKNLPDYDLGYVWSSMVKLPAEEVQVIEKAIKKGDLKAFVYFVGSLQAKYFGSVNIPMFAYTNKGVCVPLFRKDVLKHVKLIKYIGKTK